jgi:tetratricopeptide (TPR) repeat protein
MTTPGTRSQPVLNRARTLSIVLGVLTCLPLLPGCRPSQAPAPRVANAVDVPNDPQKIQQDAARAQTALTEAVRLAPNDPRTRLELALLYRITNQMEKAEEQLRDIVGRFPRFDRAPYHLGLLYLSRGEDRAAAQTLKAAAALAPKDPLAQVNAGLAFHRIGADGQARKFAEAALRADPSQPDVYLLLGRINDHHGTALRAIEYVQKYLTLGGDPGPGYYLIGRMYARLADGPNARVWLEKAVERTPDNPVYVLTLGRVYYDLFRSTQGREAVSCFEKAVKLDPNLWEAHRYLGVVAKDERRFADAVTHLKQAAKLSPQPYSLYFDLGHALIQSGQVTEGEAYLARYEAYRTSRDRFNARVKALNEAVAAAPKDRTKRYALAEFCISAGQYTAAENALREAERLLGADDRSRGLMAQVRAARTAAGTGR